MSIQHGHFHSYSEAEDFLTQSHPRSSKDFRLLLISDFGWSSCELPTTEEGKNG
jgi:hypothetical protein